MIFAIDIAVSAVRSEVRIHRVRRSFKRLERAEGDPTAPKSLLAQDAEIGVFWFLVMLPMVPIAIVAVVALTSPERDGPTG